MIAVHGDRTTRIARPKAYGRFAVTRIGEDKEPVSIMQCLRSRLLIPDHG